MSAVIRGAVPVVCNMLAGTMGVRVVWGNFPTASTDGKVVKMPNLPLQGEDFARWAYGFIAHEVGHIRDTDFTAWPKDDEMLRDITNILEDPRIERETCMAFPGARIWLNDLTEALLEEGMLGCIDPEAPAASQVRRWLMYRTGFEMMGYACLEQMAKQQTELMAQMFAPEQFAELNEAVRDAAAASCTAQVVAAANRIVKILKEAEPPKEEPPPSPSAESDQSDEDQDDTQGDEQPQGGDDSQGDDQPQGGDDSQGDGEPQGGDGDQSDNDQDGQPGQQQPASGADQGDGDGGQQDPVATPEQIQNLRAQLANLADPDQWGDEETDKGAMIQDQLTEAVEEAKAATGHGNSTVHMPAVYEDRLPLDGARAIAKVKRESTAIRAKLEELVQDVTMTRHSASRSGRRMVRDAGARLARGNLRVFDRRADGIDIDAAVHLLADCSISMNELGDKSVPKLRRIDAAKDAAAAMCMSFAEIEGVDTAVSAFPYAVANPSYMDHNGVRLVKAFDDDFRKAVGRIESLEACGTTPLASALLHSHQVLLEQKREQRIVIVLTDGMPDSLEQALAAIEAGRKAGIEHLGIGIGVELGHLFDTFVRIDKVADLPQQVIKLVQDALIDREQLHAA